MNTDGVVYSCIKHLYNHFRVVFFIKMHILHSFSVGDSQSLKTQSANVKQKEGVSCFL